MFREILHADDQVQYVDSNKRAEQIRSVSFWRATSVLFPNAVSRPVSARTAAIALVLPEAERNSCSFDTLTP